jgi:hypothetical protein
MLKNYIFVSLVKKTISESGPKNFSPKNGPIEILLFQTKFVKKKNINKTL